MEEYHFDNIIENTNPKTKYRIYEAIKMMIPHHLSFVPVFDLPGPAALERSRQFSDNKYDYRAAERVPAIRNKYFSVFSDEDWFSLVRNSLEREIDFAVFSHDGTQSPIKLLNESFIQKTVQLTNKCKLGCIVNVCVTKRSGSGKSSYKQENQKSSKEALIILKVNLENALEARGFKVVNNYFENFEVPNLIEYGAPIKGHANMANIIIECTRI